MNAVEFIKRYGWGEVVKAIKNVKPYEEYIIGIYNHEPVKINDGFFINRTPCRAGVDNLKQLVDAWELVGSYGGLERAKTRCYPAKHLTMDSYHRLKQAIELVESVNERV